MAAFRPSSASAAERTVQAGAAVLLVAAVVLSSCGGDGGGREQVSAYVRDVNRLQEASGPAFTRANDAYRAFSAGELPSERAAPALARAEEDIGRARARVAALRPPEDARELHRRLLEVFDMSLAFARETTQLARYQEGASDALRPLGRHNRRLSDALAGAESGAEQVRALGRYERALRTTVRKLRALVAPPLVRAAQREQVRRLGSTRAVVKQLRRAVARRDARAVARLLLRLRGGSGGRPVEIDRAIAVYDRRHRRLTRAYVELQREHTRLSRSLD